MGNSATKEARPPFYPPQRYHSRGLSVSSAANGSQAQQQSTEGPHASDSSRPHRSSRPDLSFLGISTNTDREAPVVEHRRETRQEREARKLEKERAARVKERERSMKEEHVDGGYLVTQGIYTGTEDFNKAVVRQLVVGS